MKSLFESKTVWLAILQSLALLLVAVQTEMPELAGLGILKSAIDVALRYITTDSIK